MKEDSRIMALKDIIRDVHGPNELIPLINQYVSSRPGDYREEGWHPSGFAGMCARKEVLMKLVNWPEEEWNPDTRLLKIFDVGKALHEWYQNKYLGPMGILWGKWKCSICGQIEWGTMPGIPCKCLGMIARSSKLPPARMTWHYEEIPLKYEWEGCEKPVVGHSDGLVKVGVSWKELELKSINDYGFSKLGSAKPEHVSQGKVYMELVRRKCVRGLPEGIEVPVPDALLMLYVNKDKSIEKEFEFPYDDQGARELEQPERYERAFIEKILPERHHLCTNMLTNPANDCPVGSYCFGNLNWEQLLGEGRGR